MNKLNQNVTLIVKSKWKQLFQQDLLEFIFLQESRMKRVSSKNKASRSSRRKIAPRDDGLNNVPLQNRLQQLDKMYTDCWVSKTQQSQHQQILQIQNQWIINEYFTSNYQKDYFLNQQMANFLKCSFSPLNSSTMLPYSKYKKIKQTLPKPKLLTVSFIRHQRQQIILDAQKKKQMKNKNKLSKCLKVGQKIWAIHPICNHVHPGQIYAQYKDNISFVKFDNPKLGTLRVSERNISADLLGDQDMPSLFRELNPSLRELVMSSNAGLANIQNKFKDLNLDVFCSFTNLLELKYQFLMKMSEMNDNFQATSEKEISPTEIQLEEYGWVGSMIGLINVAIKYLMSRYQVIQGKGIQKNEKFPYLKINEALANSWTNFSEISGSGKQMPKNVNDEIKVMPDSQNLLPQNIHASLVEEQINKIWQEYKMPLQSDTLSELIKNSLGLLSQLINSKSRQLVSKSASPYLERIRNLVGVGHPEMYQKIAQLVQKIQRNRKEQ